MNFLAINLSETITQSQFFESVHHLSSTSFVNLFLEVTPSDRCAAFWSERGFQHPVRADRKRFSQKFLKITGSSPYELNTWRNGKLELDSDFKSIVDDNKKTGYSIKRFNIYGRRNTHPFKEIYIKENPEMPGNDSPE